MATEEDFSVKNALLYGLGTSPIGKSFERRAQLGSGFNLQAEMLRVYALGQRRLVFWPLFVLWSIALVWLFFSLIPLRENANPSLGNLLLYLTLAFLLIVITAMIRNGLQSHPRKEAYQSAMKSFLSYLNEMAKLKLTENWTTDPEEKLCQAAANRLVEDASAVEEVQDRIEDDRAVKWIFARDHRLFFSLGLIPDGNHKPYYLEARKRRQAIASAEAVPATPDIKDQVPV